MYRDPHRGARRRHRHLRIVDERACRRRILASAGSRRTDPGELRRRFRRGIVIVRGLRMITRERLDDDNDDDDDDDDFAKLIDKTLYSTKLLTEKY